MRRTSKRQKNITNITKPKVKEGVKKSSNFLLYGLLAGIITFFTNYLFFSNDSDTIFIVSKGILILISLVLSSVIFYIIFKLEEKQTASISKYTFLLLLLYSIGVSLIPIKEYSNEFVILYQKLTAFQNILILPSIVLGIISVWIHKSKLQQIINDLYTEKEVQEEKTSIKERILNPIKQLFSKKEILSTSLLFVIIGISIFTLFYRLDYFDLYSDEAQVIEGAANYYHTGESGQWDFVKNTPKNNNYSRGWIHLEIISWFYKILGISVWTTRFVSVFFSLIFEFLVLYVSWFFTKNKLSAVFITLSIFLSYDFLLLFRWARMYALLFPVFIILSLLAYNVLIKKSPEFMRNKLPEKLIAYFDFNPLIIFFFLVFAYLGYLLHYNALIILVVMFLMSIFLLISRKEKKQLTFLGISTIVFFVAISFPSYSRFLDRFSFFEASNDIIYLQLMFSTPFSYIVNIILIAIILGSLFFIKNKEYTNKFIFLLVAISITWILFAYIFVFDVSFRYVGFIVPLAVIFIILSWDIIIRSLFNKIVLILFYLLLIVSISSKFYISYDMLYEVNKFYPAKPSKAFPTIVKNYKQGELIYKHWASMFYLDNIDSTAELKNIAHYKPRPFKEVYEDIQKHTGTWITWHTQNNSRVGEKIIQYASNYFIKYHGHGIDSSFVELYYATPKMLVDTNKFNKLDKFIPSANLNLKNKYTISFWLSYTKPVQNPPFIFTNLYDTIFEIEIKNSQINLLLKDSIINSAPIIKKQDFQHIIFSITQQSEQLKTYFIVNSKRISATSNKLNFDLIKFKVNRAYKYPLDNISIYYGDLSTNDIDEISKSTDTYINSEGEVIKSLYNWKKNK